MTDLSGKVAIVTGAGRGIGRAIASELASAGCRLALCSPSESSSTYAHELAADGFDAVGSSVDVSDIEEFRRFVGDVAEREGTIDILVNNAGVNHSGAVATMKTEAFDEVFAVNVRGLFYAIQAVLPFMSEQRAGKIVNISSVVARTPVPLYTAYSSSKAAVLSLTRGLALELAPHNINVNAVCPANIWSDIWDSSTRELTAITGKSSQEFFEETIARQPFGRPQTGDEIGAAVVFLCSDGARDITGEAIFVTGGL
jgi:NAD(P)-dependent dehydrogenase (short-subunit alcohol dehydrogenase family)